MISSMIWSSNEWYVQYRVEWGTYCFLNSNLSPDYFLKKKRNGLKTVSATYNGTTLFMHENDLKSM